MGDAVTLTRWIGTGRRLVMADRVLRKGREPFGLNEVNRRLAALGQEAA
jgi:hypothetical protein